MLVGGFEVNGVLSRIPGCCVGVVMIESVVCIVALLWCESAGVLLAFLVFFVVLMSS